MNIGRFLFISVKSKPIYETYRQLKENNIGLSLVWKNYCSYVYNDASGTLGDDAYELCWLDKSQNVPEFCELEMICLGFLSDGELKTKYLSGDEKTILTELNKVLDKVQTNEWILCGWNIKNYDVPLLNKRFLINKIKPSPILPKSDTKPWEMKQLFDLKEFWNGTASRGINSIDALYYSVCDDTNTSIIENQDQEQNVKNEIVKMFKIIKEFSEID